jgi:hypothetical protein
MIRGLRAGDAGTFKELCGGDMKLLLRLGALLDARLSITALALESAAADPAGKRLLMDRRLKDADETAFCALMVEHGAASLGLALVGEEQGAEPGWRLLAIEDELGNQLLAAMTPLEPAVVVPVVEPPSPSQTMLASLTPALRAPVEGLLAARADDQRAAALEQLRYAAPPLPVVAELMPMLLADSADLVRERAISLLVASGAAATVVDVIRALHRHDDTALLRLAEAVAVLPALQKDLVVAAALSAVARGQATVGLVVLCTRLGAHLAAHPALDRLLELLLPTRLSLVDLVRRLQDHAGARVAQILGRSLGAGPEQDATLVVLLAHESLGGTGLGIDTLARRGVELLVSPDGLPRERMALAGALRRIELMDAGAGIVADLAGRGRALGTAFDTSVYWLLAELCRDGRVAAHGEALADTIVHLLRAAPGPHLVAILEQGLPGLLPAADATRARLVEPMVEAVTRFVGDRTRDLVATGLLQIGAPALPPLWTVAEEHPDEQLRIFAIGNMPELIAAVSASAAGAPDLAGAAIDRLLGGLSRANQGDERGALAAAAARLLALPGIDAARVAAVEAACGSLGRHATEAWGHLAAAPGCPDARRRSISEHLLAELTADIPDSGAQSTTDMQGETTWILDESLARHTDDVPQILAALDRIAAAPGIDPGLLRTIVERLAKQWRQVASWTTIWGPANVVELGRCLGAIAARPGFPGGLRLAIAQALQPRVLQLPIAHSLTAIYVHATAGSALADLAGRAANALVEKNSEGYYSEDEFPLLADVVSDLLAVPHLGRGEDGERLRRRIVDCLVGVRVHCDTRIRARIRALRAGLPPAMADKLAWA